MDKTFLELANAQHNQNQPAFQLFNQIIYMLTPPLINNDFVRTILDVNSCCLPKSLLT